MRPNGAALLAAIAFAASCSNQSPPVPKPETKAPPPAVQTSNAPAPAVPGAPTPVANGKRIETEEKYAFGAPTTPEGWQWIDPRSPRGFETKSNMMVMIVSPGADLAGDARDAPRLVRAVSGDFDLETNLSVDPREARQGAGLLVFRNDSNYLRFERCFDGDASGLCFDSREDETSEPLATPAGFPVKAKNVHLKLTRRGREFAAFWREPGGEWKPVARVSTSYPSNVLAGIFGASTASSFTAAFDYVKLAPAKNE